MKAKKYLLLIFIFVCTTITFANANSDNRSLETQDHPTIIESLENGESYTIEITSVVCFNGTRQTVHISKEADVLTVSFKDFSKVLTAVDINAFIRFELQLRSLQIGGCTTVDTYVIHFRNETFRTSDATCSWNGGKKLLNAIR